MFASIAFSFIFFVQNKEKAWLTNNPGRRNVRTYGRAHTYTLKDKFRHLFLYTCNYMEKP